jgi:hypothetical protein
MDAPFGSLCADSKGVTSSKRAIQADLHDSKMEATRLSSFSQHSRAVTTSSPRTFFRAKSRYGCPQLGKLLVYDRIVRDEEIFISSPALRGIFHDGMGRARAIDHAARCQAAQQ